MAAPPVELENGGAGQPTELERWLWIHFPILPRIDHHQVGPQPGRRAREGTIEPTGDVERGDRLRLIYRTDPESLASYRIIYASYLLRARHRCRLSTG